MPLDGLSAGLSLLAMYIVWKEIVWEVLRVSWC